MDEFGIGRSWTCALTAVAFLALSAPVLGEDAITAPAQKQIGAPKTKIEPALKSPCLPEINQKSGKRIASSRYSSGRVFEYGACPRQTAECGQKDTAMRLQACFEYSHAGGALVTEAVSWPL